MNTLKILAIIICLGGIGGFNWAQASQPGQRQPAQRGVVSVDGAAIYQAPSFDAPVVGYAPFQQQVVLSREPMIGDGGFGLFYRVRTPDGVQGFITDVDVVPQFKFDISGRGGRGGRGGSRRSSEASSPQENPDFQRVQDFDQDIRPLFFTRYWGGVIGMALDYGEKFSGQVYRSDTPFFGLKMTGPEVLFHGPPIDFNVLFYPGAPGLYKGLFSPTSSATGFLLMSDINLLFPLLERREDLVTFGFGPMALFASYKVPVVGNDGVSEVTLNSHELRLGLSLSATYTRRFNRWAARAEAKYYVEKANYPGLWLALQREY